MLTANLEEMYLQQEVCCGAFLYQFIVLLGIFHGEYEVFINGDATK